MSGNIGVSFRDLLAYNHHETERWHRFFVENPSALDVEVGGLTGKLRELVKHIFQTELFFAAKLNGEEPQMSWLETITDLLDEVFALHEKAHGMMAHFLANATEDDMTKTSKFSHAGGFEASARKMATQFFWHGFNHWGQVAMLVRQAGFETGKPHDIIISPKMK
jgi:uncharacterized damage-inducible protein DinB